MFIIKPTADGSSTLFGSAYPSEAYHSDRGAVGEARHVFIRFLRSGDRVLELGLGSGLNALLAWQTGLGLDYTAVERYPIDWATVRGLSFYGPQLEALHAAPWGRATALDDRFSFRKVEDDFLVVDFAALGPFDTIFFDAFAPDVVPDQWSEAIFAKIFAASAPGAQLMTYTAKGAVRRAMQSAGWQVEKLQGALGKRHMLLGMKF